ncbi:MAG: complex I NDUFA9 subunit family protein [Proteobacteria bacterium]|nr:complex I NDUFA9 subunit family protein [Pseudomonadota bacterium]
MRPLSIVLLGGTGFVGSHLAGRLVRDGHRVRVLTRDPARHRELLVLPSLELVRFDVHDAAHLPDALRGADAVVNLVGILHEGGGARFRRVHAELPRTVALACRSAGVPRLLHVSSIGAEESAPSAYLRSKGLGERLLREDAGPVAWTVFRPSVIFGPGDQFVNRFARLLRLAPVLPIARAGARLAPVYVGDVVEALVGALASRTTERRVLELCGPDVYTLGGIVREVARSAGLRRLVIGLPGPLGWLQAAVLGLVPGKPMTLDNYRSLGVDSVCRENGFAIFGLVPASLASLAPTYLGAGRKSARLDAWRRATAGRDATT